MKKDEQIQTIVREIANDAIENKNTNAAVVFTQVDKRVSVSVAGTQADLVMLIAKAVSEAGTQAEVLEAGLLAAPLAGILFGKGKNVEVCDCPDCTADRAAKAKNTVVN